MQTKLKFYILLLLFPLSINLLADKNITPAERPVPKSYLKTLGKIDLGFSGLGLSIETPIFRKVLFEAAAGVGAGYKVNEDFQYRFYFDNPAFFTSVHAKYYFNQQSRVDQGRPVSFNAGNFFGVKLKYTSPTLGEKKTWHTLLAGCHWGMQRKMGKHFLYQLNLGVGAAIDVDHKTSTHVTLFPDFNFRMSYVLPF